MRIKILSSAVDDLNTGCLFYEKQGEGLGEYFFDSIFSDIDSLQLYAGIHQKFFGYHRLLSKRFPSKTRNVTGNPRSVTTKPITICLQSPRLSRE